MDQRAAAAEPRDSGGGEGPSATETLYKPGDPCGPYRIDAFLDAGGFAEVYAATNLVSKRRAALKVLQSDRARVKEVLERFQREIQLLATVQHVNVVSFYEAGGDGVHIWAAMELLEGRSLRAHMHDKGPLDVEEGLTILFELACGVAAAQELGVVHRDLKPENVFVTDTKPRVAKVLDWGIAKFEGWGFQSTGRGRRNMLGTPSYMSPEQIDGETPSFASDVYQAGVIGYEMFAGKHLWSYQNGDLPTQMQMCERQARGVPRPLTAFGVREDVWRLIEKALQKRKEDRFPTMDAFAAAVWELLTRIRNERKAQNRRADQRNPPDAEGKPLGSLARRAYEPAQTPPQETPPPLPPRKVELRLVKGPEAKPASAEKVKLQKTTALEEPAPAAPKRAPIHAKTLPIEDAEPVADPTWAPHAPAPRPTEPMPAPGSAREDHAPAWLPATAAKEGEHYLDYIVPRDVKPRTVPPVSAPVMPPVMPAPTERERPTEPKGRASEEGAPQWLVIMMITSAVASVTIAGYYVLLRDVGGVPAPVAASTASATAAASATAEPSATGTAEPSAEAPIPAAPASASAASARKGTAAQSAGPRRAPPPPPVAAPTPTVAPAATTPRAPHRLIDVEN
jgi:serine/threonine-protein kinase